MWARIGALRQREFVVSRFWGPRRRRSKCQQSPASLRWRSAFLDLPLGIGWCRLLVVNTAAVTGVRTSLQVSAFNSFGRTPRVATYLFEELPRRSPQWPRMLTSHRFVYVNQPCIQGWDPLGHAVTFSGAVEFGLLVFRREFTSVQGCWACGYFGDLFLILLSALLTS